MSKVSIIITAHNYAQYLKQAVDSALGQNYPSEVIVVDDGSSDNTPEIIKSYGSRVKAIRVDSVGLAAASNAGVAVSSGVYVVRLDADDWLHPNAAGYLAWALDNWPVDMVYCDHWLVNEAGEMLEQIKHLRASNEVTLFDRPAPAAGAMYRRSCFDAIGGYNETLRHQEDYDFWIKFIERFRIGNYVKPLYYRRQHANSMSNNFDARMKARRQVKRAFVQKNRKPRTTEIINVANPIPESRFIDYCTTNAELIVIRHISSPFITQEHITEAVDTLLLYDTDSVIAVVEDKSYHWKIGMNGLTPVGYQKRVARQDRDLVFREAGGLYVVKRENIIKGDMFGRVIGHIEMSAEEAWRAVSPFEKWVAGRVRDENWKP